MMYDIIPFMVSIQGVLLYAVIDISSHTLFSAIHLVGILIKEPRKIPQLAGKYHIGGRKELISLDIYIYIYA